MNKPATTRWLRRLLFLLILTVVFEGLGRRIIHGGIAGQIAFFTKDLVVLAMIPLVFQRRLPAYAGSLVSGYRTITLLLIPNILLTAFHDPLLALFGVKQYLLYPVVALAVVAGFANDPPATAFRHLRRLSLLIIPTALMAILQLRLPPDHWLNTTSEGQSLEAFAAAGRLRISSTFPFVAQFCMFLNAAIYLLAAAILKTAGEASWIQRWLGYSLVPLLIVSTFATGSRGAVIGGLGILCATGIFVVIKGRGIMVLKFVSLMAVLVVSFSVVAHQFPLYFEAYLARSAGTAEETHTAEITERISGMFTKWFTVRDPLSTLLGHGLGTMSNGTEIFSSYSGSIKTTIGWGETDLANTYSEGGLYLIVVWLGYRLWMLKVLFAGFLSMKEKRHMLPCAFLLGYAVITGVAGTLGIQPPLSIWWWTAIGFATVLTKSMTQKELSAVAAFYAERLQADSSKTSEVPRMGACQ